MSKKKTEIKLSQPIDLRYKYIKGLGKKRKVVLTSLTEQKRFKKILQKIFPDNLFYDNLNEQNSLIPHDKEPSINTTNKPINLYYIYKRNIFGKYIQTVTTTREQKKFKKILIQIFPDSMFYDNLNDKNSLKLNQTNKTLFDPYYSGFWIIESQNDDHSLHYHDDYEDYINCDTCDNNDTDDYGFDD